MKLELLHNFWSVKIGEQASRERLNKFIQKAITEKFQIKSKQNKISDGRSFHFNSKLWKATVCSPCRC